MKELITKFRRPLILIAIILVFTLIFTTAAITSPQKSSEEIILDISTCSKPEGKVVAHGIDISVYQGDVDFEKVKESGVDFVIIRAGATGFGDDDNFEQNYKGAVDAGLDVGCYYYTYSTNAEEIGADAEKLLEIIKGKEFDYPVFLDFEEETLNSADRIETNTEMIDVFCRKIKLAGYYPGVYTSSSVYENYLDTVSLGSTWDFWVASYNDHTYDSDEYSAGFSMWQYSNLGKVDGIDSDVDMDVSFVDYPTIIREFKSKLLKYSI